MNYAELLSVLTDAAEFIEEEAENRSHAGSEMSDYEREPRELAERIRVWVEELR